MASLALDCFYYIYVSIFECIGVSIYFLKQSHETFHRLGTDKNFSTTTYKTGRQCHCCNVGRRTLNSIFCTRPYNKVNRGCLFLNKFSDKLLRTVVGR